MSKKKRVILGVTGSIAAFKAADIARALVQKGCQVSVVMTQEAENFITPLTLQLVSSNKVYRGMFEVADAWDVEHVSLAESADLVLIAPATAHTIAKLATGLCDDLLTCVVLATRAQVLVAPAMNDKMYAHKATQENISRLKALGYKLVGPVNGRLACGTVGIGRMSEVDDIVRAALSLIK